LVTGSPTFTSTDLGVAPYGAPVAADQPGAAGSVATNYSWLISADWRNNVLATAHNATTPGDGSTTTHAIWYEVDTSGTPFLKDQGVIDSGPGVHSYMPSAALDGAGDLGITYMESSNSEYVSMWVGIHGVGDPAGSTTTALARTDNSFMSFSSRTGDYSSAVVDADNPSTFWMSSEYSPVNSGSDIWATYISSFHLELAVASSDPAAGSVIGTTPNDFVINWTDAIDPTSVDASDLSVNGLTPDSVSISPDNMTTTFHYVVSPVTTEGL